jgi:hypothetical protein
MKKLPISYDEIVSLKKLPVRNSEKFILTWSAETEKMEPHFETTHPSDVADLVRS